MQIESLKIFCDLVETQSFTRTAQINNITQSAVSQLISSIEKHFKVCLIERNKRQFRLTPEGQILYTAAKQIVKTYEELSTKFEEAKNIVSGIIRVATIYSVGLHALSEYVKEMLRLYPGVSVEVEFRRPHQIYEDVLSNLVDMGIVAYPMQDSRVTVHPLWVEEMVVICHPDHELAGLEKVFLKDISGKKFIGFDVDTPTRRALDRLFKQHGVDPCYVMQFDNVETVKRAVEINAGISIVPLVTVKQEIEKKTLVAIPFAEGRLLRPIGAIYKRDKVLSMAMKKFLGLLEHQNMWQQFSLEEFNSFIRK